MIANVLHEPVTSLKMLTLVMGKGGAYNKRLNLVETHNKKVNIVLLKYNAKTF